MPAPVALAAIPIITAAGRFAAPYLAKELGKLGMNKFVSTYGKGAFNTLESLSKNTTMVKPEAMPMVNPEYNKGTKSESVATTGAGLVIGGAPKEVLPPPEPFTTPEDKPTDTTVSTPIPKPIDTTVSTPIPEKQQTKLSTPIPEPEGPIIFKKDDIKKQTEQALEPKAEFGPLTETEKQTAQALMGDQPEFYSRVVKSIKDAKPNKLTKNKWKSFIQADKNEIKYLGLDKLLQGNESITKQELLDFVDQKNIADSIEAVKIPEGNVNQLYNQYSLAGDNDTKEIIVYQYRKIKPGTEGIFPVDFQSNHFPGRYGKNTFAHTRLQTGYDQRGAENMYSENESNYAKAKSFYNNLFKNFKNTTVIDEIQSDWIQELQKSGSEEDYVVVRGRDITEEFLKNYDDYIIENQSNSYGMNPYVGVPDDFMSNELGRTKSKAQEYSEKNPNVIYKVDYNSKGDIISTKPLRRINQNKYYVFDKTKFESTAWATEEDAYEFIEGDAISNFPIRDSKKFVEFVLNNIIKKSVEEGKDSIAITNGDIQAQRYPTMGDAEKKGLKKFYDTIVYDQLEKIAKKYNTNLEKFDIDYQYDSEQAKLDQEDILLRMPRTVKESIDEGYSLQKITLQELWDRTKDTDIPAHTSLYSATGRGQGADYLETFITDLVDTRPIGGVSTGLGLWEQIRDNEVYVFKAPTSNIEEEGQIVWEMPIVPVKDAAENELVKNIVNMNTNERQDLLRSFTIGGQNAYPYDGDNINNIDLIQYTEYLRNYKLPEDFDISYQKEPRQLIKMKLPKKLQKDILSKPIKLSKAKQQTDRLFA